VERVVEVATKVPTDVEPKRALIEKIHQRLTRLPQQTPQIPVTPVAELERMLAGAQTMLASQPGAEQAAAGLQQVRDMLQKIPASEYVRRVQQYQQRMAADLLTRLKTLQAAANPEPPELTDLPESVATRFIGKNGRYLMHVYSKANIWDVGPMGQFVHEIRSVDPEATGNPLQVYEASREMKRSFEKAAWYALLVIIPLVFLDFRRLSHMLLAALPMGVGILETLGLMGLLDIPLNPANMIVLPLTLGLGMDTGINLVHEMRCHRSRYRGASNPVIVAVVVNTLTTMVGFGALMIANHQGLQSLGRVLTISMAFNMFNSLLLPNLLCVGRFAASDQDGDDEQEDDEDDDARDDPYDEYAADEESRTSRERLSYAA
jgi:predicted RND superfamily exporter protein